MILAMGDGSTQARMEVPGEEKRREEEDREALVLAPQTHLARLRGPAPRIALRRHAKGQHGFGCV